jgi:hypothetical protein
MRINEFAPVTKRTGAGSVTTVGGNEIARSTPKIGGMKTTNYADGSIKQTNQTNVGATNISTTRVNGIKTNTDMSAGNMKVNTAPVKGSNIPKVKSASYKMSSGKTIGVREDGVIVPGVNTTVDVKPGETERQAAKFGNGKIKPLHKKAAANSSPHALFNMGLTEGQKMMLEALVKQSSPIKVMYNLAARKDNEPFPIKLDDGSVIKVRPGTARRVVMKYLDASEAGQASIDKMLWTSQGVAELLKKV